MVPGDKIELDFPSTPPASVDLTEEQVGWLCRGLGIDRSVIVFMGETLYDVFVEITHEAFLTLGAVQYSLLGNFEKRGVIITCVGGNPSAFRRAANILNPLQDAAFLSRFFAPRYFTIQIISFVKHSNSALIMSRFGIDEDPVTGSAHCGLAPYWFDKFGGVSKNVEELVGFQASARGGLITVKLAASPAAEVSDDESSGMKCKSSSSSADRVKLSGKCFTTLKSQLLI
jgi:hypothetical protein